jgi:hypothetical protein
MPSVEQLFPCANGHLSRYTDPAENYAFQTYDHLGDPGCLQPLDFLAPALLKAPVRGMYVIAMHQPAGAYRELRDAMARVLSDSSTAVARFEDQDLGAETGPWALVQAALATSNTTSGIKASKVTKILHRKRHELVPIFDSKVAGFYGVPRSKPWLLWPLLQTDMRAHGTELRKLARNYSTPDRRPLAALRALDIIVWEHPRDCRRDGD